MWFERPVLDEPFVGLVGRTMQWAFDKRFAFGDGGSYIALVSSGADSVMRLSNSALVDLALADLRSALPKAARTRVVHAAAIRERRATFSLAPGEPRRPETTTPVNGLFLAGDWIEDRFAKYDRERRLERPSRGRRRVPGPRWLALVECPR